MLLNNQKLKAHSPTPTWFSREEETKCLWIVSLTSWKTKKDNNVRQILTKLERRFWKKKLNTWYSEEINQDPSTGRNTACSEVNKLTERLGLSYRIRSLSWMSNKKEQQHKWSQRDRFLPCGSHLNNPQIGENKDFEDWLLMEEGGRREGGHRVRQLHLIYFWLVLLLQSHSRRWGWWRDYWLVIINSSEFQTSELVIFFFSGRSFKAIAPVFLVDQICQWLDYVGYILICLIRLAHPPRRPAPDTKSLTLFVIWELR